MPAIHLGVEVPADESALVRGLQDERLATSGTVVGGYGQIQARWLGVGPDPDYQGEASVRRLVLFVAHDFASVGLPLTAYTELEWENAIAGDGQIGTVEVEQAFVEARLLPALSVRAGLVLVPMGIINQWHEPPVFHGVERPSLDLTVIPSTWRELGVGITGKPGMARYELYAMTSLDPTGFDGAGIVNGRTLGAASPADAVAFAGRFELEPWLGQVIGVSAYASEAGGAGEWYGATGEKLRLSVPVLGGELDLRGRWRGIEARAVGVAWWLPQSDDLMAAYKADGSPYFPAGAGVVPTRMQGGYVELAWDVLSLADTPQQLLPFARLEAYDTQAAVPDGYEADPLRTVQEGTFGLTWRPGPAFAVKADVQLRDRKYGDDELQVDVGFGYMF